MGDVIADLRLPRDGFCVSSKVFFGSAKDPRPTQRGLSRKHVTDACHAALKRLRVDYLDLYYCHRPDPDAPVAETVHAMDTLVRQGKILYWGTSGGRRRRSSRRWTSPRRATCRARRWSSRSTTCCTASAWRSSTRRCMPVPAWHHHLLAAGLGPAHRQVRPGHPGRCTAGARRHGVVAGPGAGADAGARLGQVRRFSEVARAGPGPATLAIAWCLRNPNVSSVILGASRVSQLLQNLQALDVLEQVDAAGWPRSKPSSPDSPLRSRAMIDSARSASVSGDGAKSSRAWLDSTKVSHPIFLIDGVYRISEFDH